MTTLPWDYSLPKGDGTDVENVPSDDPLVIELGERLARFADIEETKQLEQFPNMLPRCNDCAFRKGTAPNRSLSTLGDAFKCLHEGEPFYCHKGLKEDDRGMVVDNPKRLCAGWALLYSTGAEVAKEMQRRSDEQRRERNKRKADRRARRTQ